MARDCGTDPENASCLNLSCASGEIKVTLIITLLGDRSIPRSSMTRLRSISLMERLTAGARQRINHILAVLRQIECGERRCGRADPSYRRPLGEERPGRTIALKRAPNLGGGARSRSKIAQQPMHSARMTTTAALPLSLHPLDGRSEIGDHCFRRPITGF